ncbi:TonB-dependent receptor [Flavicella sp.]|uniref:TonB-dependent receptor plug domain-containing protein n=1 Tax=Flavicella sp. TaxID=2957742 RepID=UPI002602A776|nr:TonB-dependent receptor [Flavicella sp.]MDG1806025.1 TonB-dependent receptor [Flavicella sp.]
MDRIIILFLLFLVGSQVGAQSLTVLGSDSSLPIKGVSVSNKDKSIVLYSDKNGQVDITIFEEGVDLFFYHHLYLKEKLSKSSLKKSDEVFLDRLTEALKEVVVSVTRSKQKKNRIAEQIEVVSSRDIKNIAPQSSADLLAKVPSIKVQKSQFGGGSPVLRGMEANRVLLVVDGVRMNNAIYRKGHLQNGITVSPSILDRVEVLFGPSAVMYGSDALGGVIHYYTKSLKTSEFNEVESSIFSRYSSVNNEITTSLGTELSFQKWASYTSVSYSNFGDLKMGTNRKHGYEDWGKVFEYSNNSKTFANPTSVINEDPTLQKNTGFSQLDILQKVFIPISNELELLFNVQYSESSDIPRFDRLTEYTSSGDLKFAEWSYGPQKRFMISSQVLLSEVNNWIDNGTITVAYQDITESRIQRKFSEIDKRSYRNENVDVFSVNGDFSVGLTKRKDRIFSYGFELVYNKVHSKSQGDNLIIDPNTSLITGVSDNYKVQSRYPDGGSDYFTQAVYAEYRQDLNSKNTLNTGLRFTGTQLNAKWIDDTFITLPDSDISLKNAALTATLGHVYKPTRNTKFSAVLSSGFRSPNVDDVGKIREKGGNVTVPNIVLKPEFAYNSEIGVLQYFNNRLFSVGANAYYTLLNNYIIRAPFDINTQQEGDSEIEYDGEMAKVFANVNRGQAYIYGGSVNFRGEIDEHWLFRGGVNYTKGKTYDTRENMSSIPPIFGNLGVTYKIKKFDFDIEYEFNAAKKPSEYNINEGIDNIEQTPVVDENADSEIEKYAGTPSWELFHFSVFYEVSRDLELQFRITNIFDRHYKEFASGISAPGRNFSASVRYLF